MGSSESLQQVGQAAAFDLQTAALRIGKGQRRRFLSPGAFLKDLGRDEMVLGIVAYRERGHAFLAPVRTTPVHPAVGVRRRGDLALREKRVIDFSHITNRVRLVVIREKAAEQQQRRGARHGTGPVTRK